MLIINVFAQFNNVRNTYQMYNFSINPTESQPSGNINSNHIYIPNKFNLFEIQFYIPNKFNLLETQFELPYAY